MDMILHHLGWMSLNVLLARGRKTQVLKVPFLCISCFFSSFYFGQMCHPLPKKSVKVEATAFPSLQITYAWENFWLTNFMKKKKRKKQTSKKKCFWQSSIGQMEMCLAGFDALGWSFYHLLSSHRRYFGIRKVKPNLMWAHLATYILVGHAIFWHGCLVFSVVNRELSECLMRKKSTSTTAAMKRNIKIGK